MPEKAGRTRWRSGDDIFMSRCVSNLYRVLTPQGDVLINTGISFNAAENHRRMSAVSSKPIKKIIFTQSHEDHIGGWHSFNAPGIETIAQANYLACARLLGRPAPRDGPPLAPFVEP